MSESKDGGNSWSAPAVSIEGRQTAGKIVQLPDGTALLPVGSRFGQDAPCIARSQDGGTKWALSGPIDRGEGEGKIWTDASLLRYDDGRERCVGCDLCEAACPSRCIKVISAEDPTRPLQRYATEFYIDITKCVFCGYCVEACPVNALAMTKMYEFSTHDKRTLLFDKKRLYDIGERHLSDAKKYLYAHNQEKNVEESREYRYYFPQSVLKATQSTPKHLS